MKTIKKPVLLIKEGDWTVIQSFGNYNYFYSIEYKQAQTYFVYMSECKTEFIKESHQKYCSLLIKDPYVPESIKNFLRTIVVIDNL